MDKQQVDQIIRYLLQDGGRKIRAELEAIEFWPGDVLNLTWEIKMKGVSLADDHTTLMLAGKPLVYHLDKEARALGKTRALSRIVITKE